MIRSRLAGLALSVLLAVQPALALAQSTGDCASQVQSAESAARTQYVNGMAGLATNNFSQRPASYTNIACLDKFMQGNMDTLFKPPQLSSLLSQVLNFACQQAKSALQSAMGNTVNLQSLIGSMSGGGINIQGLIGSLSGGGINLSSMASLASGGGIVNLGSMLGTSSSSSASTLQQLLPATGGSYSSGGISIGTASTTAASLSAAATSPSVKCDPTSGACTITDPTTGATSAATCDTTGYCYPSPSPTASIPPPFSCNATTGACQTCDQTSGVCTPATQYLNCDQNGCTITDPSNGVTTATTCDGAGGTCVPAGSN